VNSVDFPENGTPTSPMSFTSGERISRLPPEGPERRTGRRPRPAETIWAVRRGNFGRSVSAVTADPLPMSIVRPGGGGVPPDPLRPRRVLFIGLVVGSGFIGSGHRADGQGSDGPARPPSHPPSGNGRGRGESPGLGWSSRLRYDFVAQKIFAISSTAFNSS
jgi:hypothetical protein